MSIYIASKTRHANRWRELRSKGVPINSTWIDEAEPGESKSLSDLWNRCISEASSAAALIVYEHPTDAPIKGALAELGAALAMGVPVFWVGWKDGYTIGRHRLVTLCATFEIALEMALAAPRPAKRAPQ